MGNHIVWSVSPTEKITSWGSVPMGSFLFIAQAFLEVVHKTPMGTKDFELQERGESMHVGYEERG